MVLESFLAALGAEGSKWKGTLRSTPAERHKRRSFCSHPLGLTAISPPNGGLGAGDVSDTAAVGLCRPTLDQRALPQCRKPAVNDLSESACALCRFRERWHKASAGNLVGRCLLQSPDGSTQRGREGLTNSTSPHVLSPSYGTFPSERRLSAGR